MNTKLPNMKLLVTLEALLVERNVTKAAARLNLSQPAVSSQLNQLREWFDDPLLMPVQRGMMPTAKGTELLEPLRQALDQVRATVATHRNFNPLVANMVCTIACTDYLQAGIVTPLVMDLRKTAPRVRIALRHLDFSMLEAQMERGDVDLALLTPQAGPQSLRSRHLFDERYVLIGRRNHPKLRTNITIEQFARLEHVMVSLRGGGFDTSVDTTLTALGFRRNVVLSASSFLFVLDVVSKSNFVALVPERLVRDRRSDFKWMDPPFPVVGFEVGMVWHTRAHGHSGQRWLREKIVALMRQTTTRTKSARPSQ